MEVWPTFWGEGRPRPGREGATTCPGRPAPHCGRGSERESRPQCTREGGCIFRTKRGRPRPSVGSVQAARDPQAEPPTGYDLALRGASAGAGRGSSSPPAPLAEDRASHPPPSESWYFKAEEATATGEGADGTCFVSTVRKKESIRPGRRELAKPGAETQPSPRLSPARGRPHRVCDVTDTRAASAGNAALPWTWQPAPWPAPPHARHLGPPGLSGHRELG